MIPLCFCQGLLVHLLPPKRTPQPQVSRRRAGFTKERLLELRDGFVITPQVQQVPAEEALKKGIERVQVEGPLNLRQPFLRTSHRDEEIPVEKAGFGQVRVQLEHPLELSLGTNPVPFVRIPDTRQNLMNLRERVVQLNG